MKSRLFLFELIFTICLFSLSAAVCLSLFANARQTQTKADALNRATLLCDSAAARIQNDHGLPDERIYYYDDSFSPCSAGRAAWIMSITDIQNAGVSQAQIQFSGADTNFACPSEILFSLTAGY